MVATSPVAKPLREVGGLVAMSLDTLVQFGHPPFVWRQFVHQSWFVARVSLVRALLLNFVFNAFVIFILDVLLIEIGAEPPGRARPSRWLPKFDGDHRAGHRRIRRHRHVRRPWFAHHP